MSAFEDFVNEELPQRPVVIRGSAEATGNPNDSVLPKVNFAPIGTLYLQDDTTPRVWWSKLGTDPSDWDLDQASSPQFIVDSEGAPYDEIADAVLDAALVATESNWATVLVRSGDYGDGSVVDLPPWIRVLAEYTGDARGEGQSVEFHGGFRAQGVGERVVDGLKIYAENPDAHRLIEVPDLGGAATGVQLSLVRCQLEAYQNPQVDGGAILTRCRILMESCRLNTFGTSDGVFSPIHIQAGTVQAQITSHASNLISLFENHVDDVLILVDGDTETAQFQGEAESTVQGTIKGTGGFFQAITLASGSYYSNNQSAADLGPNCWLYFFDPAVQVSSVASYTIKGTGRVWDPAVLSGFSDFLLDPGISLIGQGGWYGFDPAVPGDWSSPPVDLGAGLDEVAARQTPFVVSPTGPYTSIQDAIDAASAVAASDQWQTVRVEPGSYVESVAMEPFVALIGDGDVSESPVQITGTLSFADSSGAGSDCMVVGVRLVREAAANEHVIHCTCGATQYLRLFRCVIDQQDDWTAIYQDGGHVFLSGCDMRCDVASYPLMNQASASGSIAALASYLYNSASGACDLVRAVWDLQITDCEGRGRLDIDGAYAHVRKSLLASEAVSVATIAAAARLYLWGANNFSRTDAGDMIDGSGSLYLSSALQSFTGRSVDIGGSVTIVPGDSIAPFLPTVPGDWTSSPETTKQALDELAARPAGGGLTPSHGLMSNGNTTGYPIALTLQSTYYVYTLWQTPAIVVKGAPYITYDLPTDALVVGASGGGLYAVDFSGVVQYSLGSTFILTVTVNGVPSKIFCYVDVLPSVLPFPYDNHTPVSMTGRLQLSPGDSVKLEIQNPIAAGTVVLFKTADLSINRIDT